MSVQIIPPTSPVESPAAVVVECFVCDQNVPAYTTETETVYDSPYSDPREVHLCEDCHLQDDNSDFSYWHCDPCERYICQRNLGNGYQSWFKRTADDEVICCACYQADRLKNGQPADDFQPGRGQYEIRGDFYDDSDLEQAGFAKHPHWRHTKVSQRTAADYCIEARDLIDNGRAVITQYRNLSIFGDEGYVTMWTRPPQPTTSRDHQEDDHQEEEDEEETNNKRPRTTGADDDEEQGSPLKRPADQGDDDDDNDQS